MSRRTKVLYVLLTIGTVGVLVITVPRLVETVTILDVRVHRVNYMGHTADCWNVFSPHRIRPLAVPTWTPTEYHVGNVRIDVRIRNDARRTINFRFDKQTFGRETLLAGKRISTNSELVQPGTQRVFVHWMRMWAENITQKCWIVNSETGEELAHFHFNLDRASTRNASKQSLYGNRSQSLSLVTRLSQCSSKSLNGIECGSLQNSWEGQLSSSLPFNGER